MNRDEGLDGIDNMSAMPSDKVISYTKSKLYANNVTEQDLGFDRITGHCTSYDLFLRNMS